LRERGRLSVGVVAVGGAVGQASRADARVRVGARAVGGARAALRGGRVGARARAGGAALGGGRVGAARGVAVTGAAAAAGGAAGVRRGVAAAILGPARSVQHHVVSRSGRCLRPRTHRDRQGHFRLGFSLRNSACVFI